jgi:predicted GNAT family N-acyltransferase
MYNPVGLGALIHANRAALAKRQGQLAAMARLMPYATRDQRRWLCRVARQAERARLGLKLMGWALNLFNRG